MMTTVHVSLNFFTVCSIMRYTAPSLMSSHFPVPSMFTDPLLYALILGKIPDISMEYFDFVITFNLFNKFQCFLLKF